MASDEDYVKTLDYIWRIKRTIDPLRLVAHQECQRWAKSRLLINDGNGGRWKTGLRLVSGWYPMPDIELEAWEEHAVINGWEPVDMAAVTYTDLEF